MTDYVESSEDERDTVENEILPVDKLYEDRFRPRWFIIRNRSTLRFVWDLLIVFIAGYNAISTPI